MTPRRPIAIALAASAFYAGIFVTTAHAEMHYVRVTLVTGQQLTITVDIPPGTPVDQLQIPGLPAADRLDRGPRLRRRARRRRPRPPRRRPSSRRRPRRPTARPERDAHAGLQATARPDKPKRDKPTGRPGHRGRSRDGRGGGQQGVRCGEHRVAHGQGRDAHADADPPVPDSQVDPPSQDDPSFSLAEPGAAKAGVPNFFIDKFKIPPFLLPIYQAAGTEYGDPLGGPRRDQRDRDELRPPERRHVQRRRPGLDAVHARHLEGLRRGRQQGRPGRPVQPGRRDLRRRAVPEGRGRRQGHARRGLGLQPRRLVRGLRAPARPGHRRHADEPRVLAHGPHRGSLPGRRQGHVRRRGRRQGLLEEEGQDGRAVKSRTATASRSTPTPARPSSR